MLASSPPPPCDPRTPLRDPLADLGKKVVLLVLAALLVEVPVRGDIVGLVQDPSGRPVAGATVLTLSPAASVSAGSAGTFRLRGIDAPATLVVEHPGFLPIEVEVTSASPVITLVPATVVTDEVAVASRVGASERFAPVGFASTVVRTDEATAAPQALSELLVAAPGVAENGQGGLFQVVSIRGVARQRVATRLAGVPIVAERRAGVSTSFVDPELLGEVAVIRGPVGVLYGTGALGGVIEVWPRRETHHRASLLWHSAGDQRAAALGTRLGGLEFAIAGREADDGKTATGDRLYSRFRQTSFTLSSRPRPDNPHFELHLLGSLGEDIGKPNTLFPGEVTRYPRERHLLLRVGSALGPTWSWTAYAHPNDLETETTTSTSRERVENQALDLGARSNRSWALGAATELTVAAEWFGRRGIRAFEENQRCSVGIDRGGFPAPTGCSVASRGATLDRASLDEVSLAATMERRVGSATFQFGTRGSWEHQDDRGVVATNETVAVAFIGSSVVLPAGFEASAHVGNAVRLPTLSERLYSGLTGAGRIVGNPDLDPERALSAEIGLRHLSRFGAVALHLFRSEVDDSIERLEASDGVFTYRNLTEGTIEGVEMEVFARRGAWRFDASGQSVRGSTNQGRTLADIPADRTRIQLAHQHGGFGWSVEWTHRFEQSAFGSGEVARGASDLVAAQVEFDLGRRSLPLTLVIEGRNLLDKLWFPSADRRAAAAPGRSIGVSLRWQHR